MKAMVLAAGLGTRLRPVTDHYAKPALPFLNIPLIYFALPILELAGMNELVLNLHYKPEQIQNLAKNIPGFQGRVNFSPELDKPLGSGGGIWRAKNFLKGSGNFLVANGDEVILPSRSNMMDLLMRTHLRHDAIATLLVVRHPKVGQQFGGVWADSQQMVHGFGKNAPTEGSFTGFHYVGIQVISERVFDYLPEGESNILYDALTAAIKNGEKVCVAEETCTWFESGNPTDFLEATQACLKLLAAGSPFLLKLAERFWPRYQERKSLWIGAGTDLPANSVSDGAQVLCGNDCRVAASARLKGFVVLGDGAEISEGCHLEDCVVLPNAKTASHVTIRKEIVF